jgi:predicted PurR-regulated permease PerM
MDTPGETDNRKWLAAGVWLIATVALGFVLYNGARILAPFAMAVFVWLIMEGFARAIRRPFPDLPGWVANLFAVTVVALSVLTFVSVVSGAIAEFQSKSDQYEERINNVIRDVYNMIPQPAPAVGESGSTATPAQGDSARPAAPVPLTPGDALLAPMEESPARPVTPPPVPPEDTTPTLSALVNQYAGSIAPTAAGFISGLIGDMLLILIYVAFLYVSAGAFSRKLDRVFVRPADRARSRQLGDQVRRTMEQYLWVQTALSIIATSLTYITLMIIGLDNALFWAFVIFVLNYIPTIGSIIATVLPSLFAIVQPESTWPEWMPDNALLCALVVFAGVSVWQFLIGNFVAPRMQANSLNLSPLVVLLSLAVWGALWGPVGMFLSAPLTVLVMIVLAQVRGARWIAVLMSADGKPGDYPPVSDEDPTNEAVVTPR